MRKTDPENNTITNTYDTKRRLETTTDVYGTPTQTYGSYGNPDVRTDAKGNDWTQNFDAMGRLLASQYDNDKRGILELSIAGDDTDVAQTSFTSVDYAGQTTGSPSADASVHFSTSVSKSHPKASTVM